MVAAVAAAVAEFAMKAISGISGGVIQEANARAANTVNEANTYASNLVRAANNRLGGARAQLARFTQGVNNQRVMQNAGEAANVAAMNYRRARDSAINDSFEQQIQFAEQAGAQAAASAMSGLSGGVADIVNSTTALRKARIQGRAEEAQRLGDWDAAQRQGQILQAGWDSLDHSEISDNLDYSVDVAVKQSYSGNLFTEVYGGQDVKNLANIAGAMKGSFGFSTKNTNLISDTPQLQGDSLYG